MESNNYNQYEPMNIYEAIEAMKIAARYRNEIANSKTVFDAVRDMLPSSRKREDVMSIVRLLALTEHKGDLEKLVLELKEKGGMEFVARLGQGLIKNPLGELLSGAKVLGMTEVQGTAEV
ncbi:hypothetical protein LCGC14_0508620 [marine sediment metagenome]|uniref:Uncharacterized protein n=1 Tax=marine sediment metagenome TaxID=412755 RepID=A0A0F9VA79_9ZZZZ